MEVVSVGVGVAAIILAALALYSLFHYVLFLLATHPKDAGKIGHELNEFERRQLVEWVPTLGDFRKHDDEHRSYDDVFGTYVSESSPYSTCVFPRTLFTPPYAADFCLLKPRDGMRLLDLGCGSGAAANYIAGRSNVDITCITNSSVQEDICRRKFKKFGGRVRVIVADFDALDLPDASFDAIYSLESIGYTKDIEAWLARYWRMLKPGGRLLIRSPGSLDFCRREKDYKNVTAFFNNWRYNFLGSNLLVYFMRRLGFEPIKYRRVPFGVYGLTWNFIEHLYLWKFKLRMRSMAELEKIIWRTSKIFVFGNGYNIIVATKPAQAAAAAAMEVASERLSAVG
jgi:SAM-dependent methyltransferase